LRSNLSKFITQTGLYCSSKLLFRQFCEKPLHITFKVHPAGVESGIIITATVMNTLSDDLVLPSTTAKCLDEMSTSFSVNATTRSQTHNEVENQQNGESNDELQEFVDPDFSTRGQGLSENSLDSESCTQLISEQEVDPSLKQCLSLAKHGKGNLCMHNGIYFDAL